MPPSCGRSAADPGSDAKPGSSAALDMRRSRGKVRRCGGRAQGAARNEFDGGCGRRPQSAGLRRSRPLPPYVVCERMHKVPSPAVASRRRLAMNAGGRDGAATALSSIITQRSQADSDRMAGFASDNGQCALYVGYVTTARNGEKRILLMPVLVLSGGQCGTQAIFRYSPEIMLNTIDERHRDLLPVFTQVIFRLRDITLFPRNSEIIG